MPLILKDARRDGMVVIARTINLLTIQELVEYLEGRAKKMRGWQW